MSESYNSKDNELVEVKSASEPSSNTTVHPSHLLLTPEDFGNNPELARRHPYLRKDVIAGFKICKACQKQGVENLGKPCENRTPNTRKTLTSVAVSQALYSLRHGSK